VTAHPDAVAVSVAARVATITLQNPPANPLGVALRQGLDAALDAAVQQDARVIVLRSSVDGYFAAGADLKLLGSIDAAGFGDYLDALRAAIERIPALPMLSIAAIDGYALGGGLELAMACTMRVATPRSQLGVPEIKLGLLPGAGGTQRLPRIVGPARALGMLLTGRSAGGDEAERIGLVDHLVPDGTAAEAAAELAQRFVAGPSDALAAIVRCVHAARDLPFAEGMEVERAEIMTLFENPDAREGLSAFLDKRRPAFGP
jgi:enoyl-CoA hydratase